MLLCRHHIIPVFNDNSLSLEMLLYNRIIKRRLARHVIIKCTRSTVATTFGLYVTQNSLTKQKIKSHVLYSSIYIAPLNSRKPMVRLAPCTLYTQA